MTRPTYATLPERRFVASVTFASGISFTTVVYGTNAHSAEANKLRTLPPGSKVIVRSELST